MTADRRYLDFDAQDDGDEVVLNMKEIRKATKFMWEQTRQPVSQTLLTKLKLSNQTHRDDSVYKSKEWLSTVQMVLAKV